MTPQKEFEELFKRMTKLCQEQKWGDPFSYARGKEIYAANKLGHTVCPTLRGPDGIGPNGEEYEYKSTTNKACKGLYSGISVKKSWAEQRAYLKNEKIEKYPEHYYNRFEGGLLVESWMIKGPKVLELVEPKMKASYDTRHQRADPRLSGTINRREIETYGKRVI